MGIGSWLTNKFSSKAPSLERATQPPAAIQRDDTPDAAHQDLIHELAEEYLQGLGNLVKMGERIEEMNSYFEKHPLLGLEVFDEALVLCKNDSSRYSMGPLIVTSFWRRYNDEVERLRGGRRRPTSTPTLRGGGRRTGRH